METTKKRPRNKEGVLLSRNKETFFYYKKVNSKDLKEIFIYPREGVVLPVNRSIRVSKFAALSDKITVEIGDDIVVKCNTKLLDVGQDSLIQLFYFKDDTQAVAWESCEKKKTIINPSEETKMVINELKVFSVVTQEGFFFSSADHVEKTASISILSNDGFIGSMEGTNQRRIMTMRRLWPELNIKIIISNKIARIYIDPKKLHMDQFEIPGILTLHRVYGNEMQISQDYKIGS